MERKNNEAIYTLAIVNDEISFTPRQRQILNHILDGNPTSCNFIAETLGISPYTVGKHMKNMYERVEIAIGTKPYSKTGLVFQLLTTGQVKQVKIDNS